VAVGTPAASHVLVTLEGERVYGHRVVKTPAGASVVDLALGADCVPDVRIRVALAHRGELWTGEDRVRVHRRLNVEVRAGSERYGPGEQAVVHVRTTDARGEAPGNRGADGKPAHIGRQHCGNREFAGAENERELPQPCRLVQQCCEA